MTECNCDDKDNSLLKEKGDTNIYLIIFLVLIGLFLIYNKCK